MDFESKNTVKICRLCANIAEDAGSIKLFEKSNKLLIKQIKELTGVNLRDMPRQLLPQHICLKCNQDLSRAYEFRRQIISTQNYFRSNDFKKKLETGNEDENVPKPTFAFVPLNECDIHELPENISENSVAVKDDLPILKCADAIITKEIPPVDEDAGITKSKINRKRKTRRKSPDIKEKRNFKNCSLFNKKVADDDGVAASFNCIETTINDNVSKADTAISDNNHDEDPNLAVESEVSDNNHDEDPNFAVESEVSDEGFKGPDIFISLKKKRQKKSTDSKDEEPDFLKNRTFICHLCQTSLENLSCLKLHFQKQHKGEKIKCDLCDEKFITTKTLARHFRLHQGEKAFKCHYCDMSFTYTSSRCRHERRSHSKDVPFLCHICGKTFITTYGGKDHMVVHTKERAYHCTVCKASFLQKHHLQNHYRSTTHKNNEQKFIEEKQNDQVYCKKLHLVTSHLESFSFF